MRGEYSDFGEPTVQVALRLPESLVAAIDERRGKASRATFVAVKMTEALSPKPAAKLVVPTRTSHVDVAAISLEETHAPGCTHPKKVRGASGLLRCVNCGQIQR